MPGRRAEIIVGAIVSALVGAVIEHFNQRKDVSNNGEKCPGRKPSSTPLQTEKICLCVSLFLSKDGALRTGCRDAQFRHFLIEFFSANREPSTIAP